MKIFNRDQLMLLGALLFVLLLFGLSNALKLSLTTSSLLIVILVLVLGGLYVLLKPLFDTSKAEEKDSVALLLGEIIDAPWGKRPSLFKLRLEKIRHILVTGVTGAGKSTFIRRLIQELRKNSLSFLYVDFKGEQEDQAEILKICRTSGNKEIPQVFDLSDPANCLTCNLLTLFPSVEETVGFVIDLFFEKDANPYYKAEAERFVRHSLQLLDAAKITRSFIQIQRILYIKTEREALLRRAKSLSKNTSDSYLFYFAEEFGKLDSRDRSERFSGLSSLLSSFTSAPLARVFNAEKSELLLTDIFSKNQSLIIRIPGEAYGDLSKRIVSAFIKTLPVLISRRRTQEKRKDYFILLDEGCSYASEVLADLTKKAGSAQVKLLLTRMSDADFLDVTPSFLGKMLSSFSTHFCFHTTDPDTRETMARISMTIDDTKQTYRMKEGSQTGEASEREVQKFRVHPSQFGHLKTGECFVIDSRQQIFQKIKIFPASEMETKCAA